jgi:two-component system invasion response regulator UvrY
MRLLVVDDHLIFREGLVHLLENVPDCSVRAEICSSKDAVKLVNRSNPDIVLVGVALTDVDHISLLKDIKAGRSSLPVLVITTSVDEQLGGRLIRAGASGILTQDSEISELTSALIKISQGHRYITPSLDYISKDTNQQPEDTLSDREYSVMVAIISGKRIKQIADTMSLSIKTVSTYHSRILQKLELENDAQLIRYAIEHGIIRDNAATREKLILTEINIRTAPIIAAIREIWRQRKVVIILVAIIAILAYITLTLAIRFVF